MGEDRELGITRFKTVMLFTSEEDEVTVEHFGRDGEIVGWLSREKYQAEAFGVTNPPQLFLFFVGAHKKFTLGFASGEDPEDLARRINRWLELAREMDAARERE